MSSHQPLRARLGFLLACVAVIAAAGCTSDAAPLPASTTGLPLAASTSRPTVVTPTTETECTDIEVCEATQAVLDFVDLWWYGEPATLAELAVTADELLTVGFAAELAASGAAEINKLDPNVHVITATEAERVEPGLIVVTVSHRDVGQDPLRPALSFFDTVDAGGRWHVDATATR